MDMKKILISHSSLLANLQIMATSRAKSWTTFSATWWSGWVHGQVQLSVNVNAPLDGYCSVCGRARFAALVISAVSGRWMGGAAAARTLGNPIKGSLIWKLSADYISCLCGFSVSDWTPLDTNGTLKQTDPRPHVTLFLWCLLFRHFWSPGYELCCVFFSAAVAFTSSYLCLAFPLV